MQYKKLTHDIIGCAMKVHNTLGNGFQEVIYQRFLELEFKKRGLFYWREQEMEVFYEDVHLAQALNYLEAYNLETGLLINFGSRSLEFKRLFNNE